MYLKNTLKSKGTLSNLTDKIRGMVDQDSSCKKHLGIQIERPCISSQVLSQISQPRTVDKLDDIINALDAEYDKLTECQAEGNTTGYTPEFLGLHLQVKWCHV